jgi:adenosylmethionine---8-amino-7-oxononanoate aminotransferase
VNPVNPVNLVNRVNLIARDHSCLWHPYTQMKTRPDPLPIVRGEGVYLYLEDGRKLLDGTSSWWVNIHGHSHPRLNEALAAQARLLEHVVFANCTHVPAVDLAERLLSAVPKGLTRVFYSDNGSTAVEVALKLACQYWGNRGQPRRTFIALSNAYHGDTVGAMSVSEDSVFTRPFASMMFDVVRAHAPYCYRCPLGLERTTCRVECLGGADVVRAGPKGPALPGTSPGGPPRRAAVEASRDAETLEALLRAHGDSVAAVIVEPMLQGAGGMIVWPPDFLAGVRRLCDRFGTLLIADEVLTGFGRTGPMFGCEHASVAPDIMCLSKAITGGYMPLGATIATEAIYDAFLSDDRTRTFFHGHSFTANPLACAVAVASFDLFQENDTLSKIRQIGRWMHAGLDPLRALPIVGDVRIIGAVGIVELVSDKETREAGGYLDQIGPRLTSEFLDRGLLLRPLGNVLYFMPPYVITESETAWALEQIASVLGELARTNR